MEQEVNKNQVNTEYDYWPHGPMHKVSEDGIYMITAGTYGKKHFFAKERYRYGLQDLFFSLCAKNDIVPQAWAFMSNHYHIIVESSGDLHKMITDFHRLSATKLNAAEEKTNRRVWYQYWDKQLSIQVSYLARLKYVHYNPEHHGVVDDAREYRWCSAGWFANTADRAFRRTVDNFKIDRLKVFDDY
jgi:REP-associated tyrosine transposase